MENENIGVLPGEVDEIDRKIIAALRIDGRVPFTQVAEQLGVSPGMIRQRYKRLVDHNIVKVVTISNPLRMGYNTMALIGIRVNGSKLLEVANKISSLDEVIYLILTSGTFDIMAEVICRDRSHLLQFLTERLYQVEGVRETETFMHLKIVKEVYF